MASNDENNNTTNTTRKTKRTPYGKRLGTPACINLPATGQRFHLDIRHGLKVATWNVLTLLPDGQDSLASLEFDKYNLDLIGLCETRWRDSGEHLAGNYHYVWSGPNNNSGKVGQAGVALAISRNTRKALISWRPINERMLEARFEHRHGKLTIIVAYAPTNLAENDKKADFYALLQDVAGSRSPHDITIVLSYTNAALSRDARTNWPDVVGTTFVDRTTNDNGDRLLSFCRSTDLCIADSWFPRKQIHHWTWYSNDGFTKKAIDHIIISRRWLRCVTQCRVFRGAQLGNTDHRLLCANIRLKLKAPPSSRQHHQPDISRLADPSTKLQYQCEISNRYDALAESTDQWEDFKNTITACATTCLGRKRPRPKKSWITPATLEIIESRRSARLHGDLTEYRRLNSVRNASIKNDRAAFWQEKATTLEEAAIRKDQGTLFRELRSLRSGNRNFSTLIKDQSGRTLTSEPECIARLQEHFSELLNQPLTPPTEELIDRANHPNDCPLCTTDDITPEEVRKALGQLKNARASGICTITAELLKNGGEAVVTWLTKIFNHVWSTEQIPEDWRKGIILPFWKRKGDALTCSNHRGITLLSIPGKTFARVVINRAIPAMHHHRRPHQAGFMPGRSTTDHISAIRLLAEKAREFRKDRALFIAFIDLKAAFDSVDRDCLWHILHSIGIPPKIVRVLERLYTDTSSCVRINNTLSDWFTISSGVRQGCVAAPDLFNCIIDYLMENVSATVPGIQLGPYHLTDLEYADDAAMFATNQNDISSALAIFDAEACKLGLRTSWAKTKIMKFGDAPSPPSLHICNNDVEFVDKFTYLGSIITNTGTSNLI